MSQPSAFPTEVTRIDGDARTTKLDLLSVEEPMEIRLGYGPENSREQKSLSITMRTPGNDFELALGFLFTEGIIDGMDQVQNIVYCTDDETGELTDNVVRVELVPSLKLDWSQFERHFYTNSSCGICGKASIESLESFCPSKITSEVSVAKEVVHGLSDKMRAEQNVFEHTGGLHGSGLFTDDGTLLQMREDVGRHNAVDKLVGTFLFEKKLPLSNHILMLSGRCSFELMQKAIMARIPIIVAIGAPSNLAVSTAEEFGVTLLGFTRGNSFNIYSHPSRIV